MASEKVLFPNAIDYVKNANNNIVNNRLGDRAAYLQYPSLYERAYILVHETGEVPYIEDAVAPDETTTEQRGISIR